METTMSYARRISFLGSITAALLVLIAPLMPAYAASGSISTVAGGYIGDGGPATSARINNPAHLAVSADGTKVYIVDTYNQRIRMVSFPSGTITTVAGNGIAAFAGDGGLATAASINEANGVAIDKDGNLLIADSFNQRIRKFTPGGAISTIAGTGALGTGSHNGDNMAATSATLFYPYSVTTTTTGIIYIADSNNNRVRRIQTDQTISTIAGSSTATFGGDGGQAWSAYLNYPTDVAVDSVGNIYIADTNNHRIRKIDIATNIITTVAGNGTAAYSGDGGQATLASLNAPYGVVVDAAGNIYIADTYNNVIRMVNTAGNISTVAGSYYGYAGDGGPATGAAMRFPTGLARDSAGNLYISDQFNDCIRKMTPGGIISTIAGSPINLYNAGSPGPTAANAVKLNYAHGVGASPSGNVYIADTKNSIVRMISATTGSVTTIAGIGGDGGYGGDNSAALSAQLNNPYGVTADASGNVYIADSYNHRVRKVTPGGQITTVAGDGTIAILNEPRSVATDTLGNLYIADTNNNQVKKVTFPSGTISLVAGDGSPAYGGDDVPGGATYAKLNTPTGVAVDSAGNVFIADSGNNRIRKVNTAGTISTVAGNGTYGYSGDGFSAATAQLATPYGVTVDAAGNLYIADFYNSKVRKVDTSGNISTLVGNGIDPTPLPVATNIFVGFAGDGELAAPDGYSILYNPYSVAVDAAGNLYIADVNNWRIRKVSTTLPPSLLNVHIASNNTNTSRAKAGDTVAVTFTSSQIISTPTVTIAGRTATVTGGGTSWSASIVMTGSDPQGMISFSITYKNLSNIPGTPVTSTTDSSIVTFDSVVPNVTISTTASNPTRTAPIPVTVVFSETVTGFTSGEVTIGNGTIGGFTIVSGTTYTFNVTPTPNSVVTVNVAAGVAQDAAGNNNTAAVQLSRTYDNAAPTVTISTTASNPTRTAPIPVTVVFSEAVTGFASGDVTIGNGTLSLFTAVSGTTYTFSVTPPAQGAVTVDVAAGVAQDGAGNNNTAAVQLGMNYDSVAPTMVISAPSSTLTKTGPVTYTVTYTGADTVNLTNAYITLNTSGTATGAIVSSGTGTASRTVTISGITGDGTLGITIAAASANDLAGNTTLGGTGSTFGVDNTAPTVTISSLASNPTRTSPIPVTVTFNEAVTDFTSGDVTIGNGTISLFTAVSGTTYTFSVLPLAQGAVTVDVIAGVAFDAAAFGNTAAVQLSRTYDSVAPTMLISAPSSTLARTGPVTYTVTYSGADAVNLTNAYITLNTSGTATGTVVSSGTGTASRTVTISGIAGDGTLGITIAAASANDLAGNTTLGGTGSTFSVDNTAPIMAIGAPSASIVKSGATVTYTVTYSGADSVTLADANITLNAAGATGTVVVSGTGTASRLVTISGITGNGTLGISIAAGTASDLAGNTAAAAGPSTTFSVDSIAPTATLTSTAPDPTNTPFPVTVTFNEAVTGFTSDDVVVVNGAVGAFGGTGTIYTFTVTPTLNGAVTVNVAAGVAQDAAGNGNTAALQLSRTFDSANPTVTITSTAPNPTRTSPIPVTVIFSKAVTGFLSGDVTIGNGSISLFTAVSGTTYTFNVTPTLNGAVTVDVAAGVAQDAAANGNLAAVQLTMTYDNVAPTVMISSTTTNTTNVFPIPVTVTFSEAVTGFTSGDVLINNGSIGLFTAVSGTTYTFDITPSGDVSVTVNIAGSMAQDAAGNGNTAAAQFSRTYDSSQPTVTISTTASNPTRTSPIPVTITFSEAVTGFTSNEVIVVNGAKSSFTGSGTTYTLNVAPLADGLVTVNVAGSVAQDAAGNLNTPAQQLSRTYDTLAPSLVISAPSSTLTNSGPVTYTVIYSGADNVTLANANITLITTGTANGTVVVSGSGTASRTVTISGITGNGTLDIAIAASTASDLAGNNALAAGTSATFSVDNMAPTLVVSAPSSAVTSTGPVTYTVTYTGADAVTLANANITLNTTGYATGTVVISGSGTASRTVTISNINGNGALGISITAGTASDLAGNNALAAGPSATFAVDNATGDFNGNGVEIADALKALRIVAGLDAPTASEVAHLDVAPLLNGARQPDGKISSADVVAILRKIAVLPSW